MQSEIDKAAAGYAKEHATVQGISGPIIIEDDFSNSEQGFTAGAQWRDKQILECPEVLGMAQAIQFALIYDPQTDTYKVKHTAYPKLRKALAAFEKLRAGK